jgi:hypothetical protein
MARSIRTPCLTRFLCFIFNAGFAPRVVDLSLVTCCTLQGYNCTDRRGMAQANEYATDALRLSNLYVSRIGYRYPLLAWFSVCLVFQYLREV